MSIEIREATISDVELGLLDVFIEGYRFHQNARQDIFVNISDDKLKEELIKNFEMFKTLVILNDKKIVGYISYKIKEKTSKKIFIDQLVISKEYRGQGLGKKLIDKVKKIAIEIKCDRIELDCWSFNTNALKMYEHIGFEQQRIIYEMKL